MYKARVRICRAIVERFIKPTAPKCFDHLIYLLCVPGQLITISGNLGIWIGEKKFHMDASDQSGYANYGGR